MSVLALLALAMGGCSSGPKTIESETPLPSCDAFMATVRDLGMPDAVLMTQASPPAPQTGLACKFTPRTKADPPALNFATIEMLRPDPETREQDPKKLYGKLLADAGCQGIASANVDLPGGATCDESVGATSPSRRCPRSRGNRGYGR